MCRADAYERRPTIVNVASFFSLFYAASFRKNIILRSYSQGSSHLHRAIHAYSLCLSL